MNSILSSFALSVCAVSAYAQMPAASGMAAPAVAGKATPANGSLPIGAVIPLADQSMKSTSGREVRLGKSMQEGGLLVMFSCNTCPYVVKSQKRTLEMMHLAQKYKVGMVIINSNEAQRGEADSYAAMAEYGKAQGYEVPYVVDERSQVADAFGATRTPEVFLFNAKGVLVYKGAMEDNPSDPSSSKKLFLADALTALTKGTAIKTAETKSIGCSIKREQ